MGQSQRPTYLILMPDTPEVGILYLALASHTMGRPPDFGATVIWMLLEEGVRSLMYTSLAGGRAVMLFREVRGMVAVRLSLCMVGGMHDDLQQNQKDMTSV